MDKEQEFVGKEGALIELFQNHLIDSLVAKGVSMNALETDQQIQQWVLAETTALLGMLMDTFNCSEVNVNFLDAEIAVQRYESKDNRREYVSQQVEQLLDEKPELATKVTSIFD